MLTQATAQSDTGSAQVVREDTDGAVDLAVRIRYRGYRCFHVTGRRLSPEGMLLATRSLRIPENTRIYLIFDVDDQPRHVPAIVVENGVDGIEVLFTGAQPQLRAHAPGERLQALAACCPP